MILTIKYFYLKPILFEKNRKIRKILITKLNSEKFSTKLVNQKSILLTLNYRHPHPLKYNFKIQLSSNVFNDKIQLFDDESLFVLETGSCCMSNFKNFDNKKLSMNFNGHKEA